MFIDGPKLVLVASGACDTRPKVHAVDRRVSVASGLAAGAASVGARGGPDEPERLPGMRVVCTCRNNASMCTNFIQPMTVAMTQDLSGTLASRKRLQASNIFKPYLRSSQQQRSERIEIAARVEAYRRRCDMAVGLQGAEPVQISTELH